MSQNRRRKTDHRIGIDSVAEFARAQLIRAIDELLTAFVGPSQRRKSRVVRRRSTSRVRFESEHQRFRDIAELLTLWHSRDEYLATDGSPRPLPMLGKPSLSSLAELIAATPQRAQQLALDLVKFGFADGSRGLYTPARRSAVLGSPSALNLAYATVAATRLLRTIAHNVTSAPPALYERQLSDVTIRREDLPVFLRFVEGQAQYLVDSIDDWLARRGVSGRAAENGIAVGVGAFAWTAPDTKSGAKGRQRSKNAILPRKSLRRPARSPSTA